jgi:preprotein translocase subunit SecG
LIYLLYSIHVLISIFLILVVLLQRGKGADLSVFGGGTTQAAFGARGQANLLHKLTVICFVLFIVTTLSIGLFEAARQPSVMGGVSGASTEETGEAEPAGPAATPAAQPPGTVEPGMEAAPESGSTEDGTDDGAEADTEAPPPAGDADAETPPPAGSGAGSGS